MCMATFSLGLRNNALIKRSRWVSDQQNTNLLSFLVGSTPIQLDKEWLFYIGEMNEDREPLGHGNVILKNGTLLSSTWLHGKLHGICR